MRDLEIQHASSVGAAWHERARRIWRDPRHLQIAVLSGLWVVSKANTDFGPTWLDSVTVWLLCCASEWVLEALAPRSGDARRFDWRSPLITGLSLSLLLRAPSPWVFALAACTAMVSKRLRVGRSHLFNPANIGIVAAVLFGGGCISPGQWGSWTILAATLACLGFLVTHKASRLDLALMFVSGYATVLFGRALWLGDPLAIPLRELSSGTLVLFAFFMITDPRTTPESRRQRCVLAAAVIGIAVVLRFWWFLPNAFLYALCIGAPTMRLIEELASWRARIAPHMTETIDALRAPIRKHSPQPRSSAARPSAITCTYIQTPTTRR